MKEAAYCILFSCALNQQASGSSLKPMPCAASFYQGVGARMGKFLQVLLLGFLLGGSAYATEPLHDLVTVNGKTGLLLPEKCCWVELPPSDQLREARLEGMQCSAIGGPVGNFELADGTLSLLSLRSCGGDIPLNQIYPEFHGPVVANWVNGKFFVKVDPVCKSKAGLLLHRQSRTLTIEAGIIVASEEQALDEAACHAEP